MQPVIELDNLSVSFGRVEALRNLHGSYSGRAIGLLGPNGAGKSTLISLISGQLLPITGSVLINGLQPRFLCHA